MIGLERGFNMANKGRHVRFYGNRNKIVRIRNEQAIWAVQAVANRLGITYQEAFEFWINHLEKRNCFDWDKLCIVIDEFRANKK